MERKFRNFQVHTRTDSRDEPASIIYCGVCEQDIRIAPRFAPWVTLADLVVAAADHVCPGPPVGE